MRTIDPHTEGDPVAILLNFLTMFGSAVGPTPHARVGATRHRVNEFVALVGETLARRKGTASNEAERVVVGADQQWKPRVMGGLSSGEGLIFAVRDPSYKINKDGESVLADAGVDDKRLLAIEPEFSSVLRVAGREGNTLSEQLRRAWDGNDLRTLTKNSPLTGHGAAHQPARPHHEARAPARAQRDVSGERLCQPLPVRLRAAVKGAAAWRPAAGL